MGWLMFKLKPDSPMDNVEDLKKDWLVSFQHKFVHPLLLGQFWSTHTHWIPVCYLHQQSFTIGWRIGWSLDSRSCSGSYGSTCHICINSLCHMIGKRPYSTSHKRGIVGLLLFLLWVKVITTIIMNSSGITEMA